MELGETLDKSEIFTYSLLTINLNEFMKDNLKPSTRNNILTAEIIAFNFLRSYALCLDEAVGHFSVACDLRKSCVKYCAIVSPVKFKSPPFS